MKTAIEIIDKMNTLIEQAHIKGKEVDGFRIHTSLVDILNETLHADFSNPATLYKEKYKIYPESDCDVNTVAAFVIENPPKDH